MEFDKAVDPVDGVLGGGGAKGFGHLGFLKACEELMVSFNNVYGISIGSQVAALYTNGYSIDEMAEILQKEFNELLPQEIILALTGRLKRTGLRLGLVDLLDINRRLVKEYKLETNDKLRIVAYNLMNRKPVIFQGNDYSLADALTASMAVPLVVQPVISGVKFPKNIVDIVYGLFTGSASFEIHFDGALNHPCPGDLSGSNRAIVSKLGFVSRLPGKLISPFNMALHGLELLANPLINRIFPDSMDAVVINTGPRNIAGLNFGQFSSGAIKKMVDLAYEVTADRLAEEILAGRL